MATEPVHFTNRELALLKFSVRRAITRAKGEIRRAQTRRDDRMLDLATGDLDQYAELYAKLGGNVESALRRGGQ